MGLAAEVADAAPDPRWLAQCAWRLRQQWPHADPSSLEEAAGELWLDPELQRLDPVVAADRWLEPVTAPAGLPDSSPIRGIEPSQASGIVLAHGRPRG